MSEYKTPKRLKGFQDFFAGDVKLREFVINTFKKGYEKYGYEPLETPALEYSELILGQSGEEAEKQYYRFKDNGDRDVMLRFEVMTAMCRAVAQNINNLPLPYKRYQIQPVWRAENTQKGRYREFTQCDADTIGSSSMTADAEFIQMGLEIVGQLGFKEYEARISNKKFLVGLAEFLKVPEESYYAFQMAIDNLYKIGKDGVIERMVNEKGISREIAENALNLIDPEKFEDKSYRETVEAFRSNIGSTKIGNEALNELLEIYDYLEAAGVNTNQYKFDTTIARGLASYTGPVWEFKVKDGNVGSIAGCGRYDNAIGKYLGFSVPATGGSFGIERICDIMKDRNMFNTEMATSKVLITQVDETSLSKNLEIANLLRSNNISTMLFPEVSKLEKQLKYADKKQIPFVVIAGSEEILSGKVKLKNMNEKTQEELTVEELISKLSLK